MTYILLMFVYFTARGLNAVWIKKSEPAEQGLAQSLSFTTVFSLFQLAALLVWPPLSWRPAVPGWQIWPLCYAIFFILAYLYLFKAFLEGPANISNAVFSFYIIIPVTAGVFLWNEKLSVLKIIGLLLFMVSILLFNQSSYQRKKGKFSSKWLAYITLATASSGIGVIFTRESQRICPGYDKEYMVLYNLFVILIGLPVMLKNKNCVTAYFRDRKKLFSILGAAITQNISNMIFIYYLNEMESAIFLPLTGVLNVLAVIVMGGIFLKEKITGFVYLATAVSVVSLFILNL